MRNYLDPSEIFKGEAEEQIEKVEFGLKSLKAYKSNFEITRNNIANYFKNGKKVKKWEFSNTLVFARYDLFIDRLELIQV